MPLPSSYYMDFRIFPEEGAHPYKRDLKNLKFHILDTGHFALEEDLDLITNYIRNFARSNSSQCR
ncbi:MAG: hypothetical protein WBM44_26245 [Waterburya sp.]